MPALPVEQQELYCQEYMKDLNKGQAALRAGYSPKHAHQYGYELGLLPHVAARIAELMQERASRVGVDADYVLERLKMIADADISEFVEFKTVRRIIKVKEWVPFTNDDEEETEDDEDDPLGDPFSDEPNGEFQTVEKEIEEQVLCWKDFSQIPDEKKKAIESMKMGKNGLEIKLHSKTFSLDMIAKHIGFFEKDNKQKGEGNGGVSVYLPDNQRGDSNLPVVEKPAE